MKEVKDGKAGARDVSGDGVWKERRGAFVVEMALKFRMSSGDLLKTGLGREREIEVSGIDR